MSKNSPRSQRTKDRYVPKPTKNEMAIAQLFDLMQNLYSSFSDFDRRITALARKNLEPKEYAALLLEAEKNKEYTDLVNEEITAINKAAFDKENAGAAAVAKQFTSDTAEVPLEEIPAE